MLLAYYKQKLVMASKALSENEYFCPVCKEKLVLKQGNHKIAHFAHQIHSDCVGSEPETNQHLAGKSFLFNDLVALKKDVKIEKYLTQIKQRPDILFDNLAVEFQCSPITDQRLQERIMGYQKLKMVSFWILGSGYLQKRANSSSVLRFMRYKRSVGFYLLFLQVNQKSYLLRYQIYQVDNQIYFSEKRFSNWQELTNYLYSTNHCKRNSGNLLKITNLIETNLRNSNRNFIELQNDCYLKGVSVSGCPLICHYPRFIPPIFGNNWLNWRIEIILKLTEITQIKTEELYKTVFLKQDLNYNFPFIKNIDLFYQQTFNKFMYELYRYNFIKIQADMITNLKSFTWYQDTYAKIKAIKMISKEVKK